MTPRIRSRASLSVLAGLLLAAALLVHLPRTPAAHHAGPALLFFSSNTDDGLSLKEAVERINTPAHDRCRAMAVQVLRELSAGPALVHDTIGDWDGGVENSLLVVLPRSPDAGTLMRAAAWFGLIGDQKAVLVFRPDARGGDVLLTLEVPGKLYEVRGLLDRHGVRDRTILLDGQRCLVIVLDEGGVRAEALLVAAKAMNAHAVVRRGRSELLAAPTRAEARKRYREVLRDARIAAKGID